MPPDVKVRAFDPFFTTKAVGAGTGLGLPTVHGIVTQHGGGVTLHSEVDQGTIIEILLPTRNPAAASPARQVPEPPETKAV